MSKSPIPLSSLKLPLDIAQIRTETTDGAQAVVSLRLDEKGKLVVVAETPPEP